eukprot:1154067-Pelagomonas_calceolata.AAC.6
MLAIMPCALRKRRLATPSPCSMGDQLLSTLSKRLTRYRAQLPPGVALLGCWRHQFSIQYKVLGVLVAANQSHRYHNSMTTTACIPNPQVYARKGEDAAQDVLQPGEQQVAAAYSCSHHDGHPDIMLTRSLYSSATMMVISVGSGTHGFTLLPTIGEFILTHPNIRCIEVSTAQWEASGGHCGIIKWLCAILSHNAKNGVVCVSACGSSSVGIGSVVLHALCATD